MDMPTLASAASDLDCYGIEVLCANWTPMVTTMVEPVSRAFDLLVDAATTDVDNVEAFLSRFYQFQRG